MDATRTAAGSVGAVWLGLLLGCGSEGSEAAGAKAQAGADSPVASVAPKKAAVPEPRNDGPAETKVTDDDAGGAPDPTPSERPPVLARATKPLAAKASVEPHPGFRLEPLLQLHALAGTPAGTEYGAPITDAPLLRDDDLDTAALCTPTGEQPCAVGLSFSTPAKVTMVRLYLAAGPKYMTYKGAPRPKTVRVHTDAGHAEVALRDTADYQWITFDEAVTTRSLSLEIVDVHAGRKDARIHFAELEVYGSEGKARAPLSVDPAQAYVYFETHRGRPRAASARRCE